MLGEWLPPVDVQETATELIVRADVPAVARDRIHVDIADGILTIEGERLPDPELHEVHFHRLERAYGPFVRRLALPAGVDERGATATVQDGVLTVHLPKRADEQPRVISVEVA